MKTICQDCGKFFKNGRDFEDASKHECIATFGSMSLEELRKLAYAASKRNAENAK